MILNRNFNSIFPILKRIIQILKVLFVSIKSFYISKQLVQDRINLKKYFRQYYPALNKNIDTEFLCVGCRLCQVICPSSALDLKFSKLIDFPDSLKFGELPVHFNLDVEACIQCGHCEQICPVEALNMKGLYTNPQVDLVSVPLLEEIDRHE